MKEIYKFIRLSLFGLLVMLAVDSATYGQQPEQAQQQTTPIEDFRKLPVTEQMNYIESHSKIYDNFRAVREEMFQRLKVNLRDTLSTMQKRVTELSNENSNLRSTIDTLNSNLGATKTNLDQMTTSKNSMNFLGVQVEKGTYNSIMWALVIGMLAILVIGFLVFQRNRKVVVNKEKDLDDLKAEFEAYRKSSREAREKMALQHFNELKKLRGE
jgi:predicted  nucleic acid-binding Zn-ribbon protein